MPFLLALALGLVLTPLLGRLGIRWGLVDLPSEDGLKIHTEPKPLTGGIGIVCATLVGTAVASEAIPAWPTAAILVMLLVGVADDLRSLPPLLRLVAQLGAGAMLAAGGATFAPLGDVGPVAVVLAVPLLTNAMNIVDGQDGLATGLALIAAGGIWAIAAAEGVAGPVGPALLGALLAFLLWNRPPARVFLGDGGAYAVGCVLVVLAAGSSQSWESLLGTAVYLGILASEIVSTVLRRAVGRSPLLSGDRAHVYDLLADRLGTRERATLTMLAVGAFAAVLGWLVAQAPLPVAVGLVVAGVVAGSAAVADLWRASVRRSR